jgi:hypothetical protein
MIQDNLCTILRNRMKRLQLAAYTLRLREQSSPSGVLVVSPACSAPSACSLGTIASQCLVPPGFVPPGFCAANVNASMSIFGL